MFHNKKKYLINIIILRKINNFINIFIKLNLLKIYNLKKNKMSINLVNIHAINKI